MTAYCVESSDEHHSVLIHLIGENLPQTTADEGMVKIDIDKLNQTSNGLS